MLTTGSSIEKGYLKEQPQRSWSSTQQSFCVAEKQTHLTFTTVLFRLTVCLYYLHLTTFIESQLGLLYIFR